MIRTDHLTGLFNRRHLHYVLEQEIERTKRGKHPTTLILIDIDHFKKINDNYGHITGDQALVHIARLIQSTVRRLDIPCRYGGEELAVVLPTTHTMIGTQVAERIRLAIATHPLEHNDQSIAITASLGVASYTQTDKDSVDGFIGRTDAQLYQAKEAGRNQVRTARPTVESRSQISDEERNALFAPDDNDVHNC